MKKQISAFLLGITVGIILWITLIGRERIHTDLFLFRPLHSFINLLDQIRKFGIHSNFLGNVLLFIPIGVLFPICFSNKLFSVLISGGLLTVSIETLQLLFSRGYFEVDDLVSNLAGAIIGFSMYRIAECLKRRLSSSTLTS